MTASQSSSSGAGQTTPQPSLSVQPPSCSPLSAQWDQPLRSQLWIPLFCLIAGAIALTVDVPLSKSLVKDDALLFADHTIEAAESFGHATGVVLIVMAVCWTDESRRKSWVRLLVASLGAGLCADLFKLGISRTRPYDFTFEQSVWQSFNGLLPYLTDTARGRSFPSAHVATATGLAAALATLYPRGRTAFAIIAGCVALQRVETGAHFLSDTFAGASVGFGWSLIVFRRDCLGQFFDRLEQSRPTGPATFNPVQEDVVPAESNPAPTAGDDSPTILSTRLHQPTVKSISAVIPVFNEEENIPRMYRSVSPVLSALGLEYEILFVNDGSRDRSAEELDRLAAADPHVKVVHFRRNFGQTAAMSAGMQQATGDAIVLLDGDLQNDPADIPMMLAKLDEGYDLVHGWRKDRHDRFLDRKLPSLIANWLISKVTGFPVHDLGCTLKVLRREIAQELQLYGEMHRFIPILAHGRGARCAEVVTRHRARQFGQSKYGISRTVRVLMDLMTVKFLTRYLASPMRFFGQLGFVALGLSLLAGMATIVMKIWSGVDMTGNPLLLGSVFAALVGLQFFCMGLLGELAARMYFRADRPESFAIRRRVNMDETLSSRAA